jgi:hypothetical protein
MRFPDVAVDVRHLLSPTGAFSMNHYVTPDLCDAYPDLVQVLEPMFSNFGGRDSFGGQIVTIKCFEDNSLVKEQAELNGHRQSAGGRRWWFAAPRLAGRHDC